MLLVLAFGCFDLPPDFEGAHLIPDFHQAECSESAYDTGVGEPVATLAQNDSESSVAVGPVGFRCAQDVQGFWIEANDGLSVLVQPIDMNPAAVAGCDCLYDLTMTLPSVTDRVEVWTRGDNQSGRSEPTLEATAALGD